jgi:hypothetical protein
MGWVASLEHNLLPFSTPQSYALLSAESKATEETNNKERLGVCHDIVWCRTTDVKFHLLLRYNTKRNLLILNFIPHTQQFPRFVCNSKSLAALIS